MPRYSYKSDSGDHMEFVWSFSDLKQFEGARPPDTHEQDGVVYHRDLASDHIQTTPPALYPMFSLSLGAAPHEQAQYRNLLAEHGVKAQYNSEGHLLLESPGQRERVKKALGVVDFDKPEGADSRARNRKIFAGVGKRS